MKKIICPNCKEILEIGQFYKTKKGCGHSTYCKKCMVVKDKKYREEKKDSIKKYQKKYRAENREKAAAAHKKWVNENRDHVNIYQKEYKKIK